MTITSARRMSSKDIRRAYWRYAKVEIALSKDCVTHEKTRRKAALRRFILGVKT